MAAAAAVLAVACAPVSTPPAPTPSPVQVDKLTIAQARLGHADMLEQIQPYGDTALQRYVQEIGKRLLAGAPPINVTFDFTVLDNGGTFAYSFAHGKIVISRGLLLYLNSEAQLAAVLAHEIGHVLSLHQARLMAEIRKAHELEAKLAARFGAQQARDALGTLSLAAVRGYSREHEIEADEWGERLLSRAGYNAVAMAEVLRLFIQQESFWDRVGFEMWDVPEAGAGQGVFATHPSSVARLQLARKRVGAPASTAATDETYLTALNGTVFGLPEIHGVQRGNRYAHPLRRVGFSLPDNWYLFTSGGRLVAAARDQDAMLIIHMRERPAGESVHRALTELAGGETLRTVEQQATSATNGALAVIRPASNAGKAIRLAVLDVGTQRLSFVGLTPTTTTWPEADRLFRRILSSVRVLPEAEARRVQPLRLHIDRFRGENELAQLTQGFFDHPRERWELLNQLVAQPVPGQWIKTVR
jgi:predicted Zn-dependent protease